MYYLYSFSWQYFIFQDGKGMTRPILPLIGFQSLSEMEATRRACFPVYSFYIVRRRIRTFWPTCKNECRSDHVLITAIQDMQGQVSSVCKSYRGFVEMFLQCSQFHVPSSFLLLLPYRRKPAQFTKMKLGKPSAHTLTNSRQHCFLKCFKSAVCAWVT